MINRCSICGQFCELENASECNACWEAGYQAIVVEGRCPECGMIGGHVEGGCSKWRDAEELYDTRLPDQGKPGSYGGPLFVSEFELRPHYDREVG